jgi:lipoate---protein ligase
MFNRNALALSRCIFHIQKRCIQSSASPAASQFVSLTVAESSRYQIYLSTTDDPYLNLSIEHHLLQTTPSESTILFLYANRPCVVIGRNQNPWLEANLRRLCLPRPSTSISSSDPSSDQDQFPAQPNHVEFVRRRSGGGTVFHGPGNVNYSVICPSEHFTRDKHANMVARALQTMNPTAHVNVRHDIVLTANEHSQSSTPEALPSEASPPDPSAVAIDASESAVPRKVSGSAFKLTRGRALHHGTCLLCTPHLGVLSTFLASPARWFLQARGVDSVRSPVANVLPPAADAKDLARNVEKFHGAVLRAFADLYPAASLSKSDIRFILDAAARSSESQDNANHNEGQDVEMLTLHSQTIAGVLGPGLSNLPSIKQGTTELRSEAWLFGQTPRFTLSSARKRTAQSFPAIDSPAANDGDAAPSLPSGTHVYLYARGGVISGASLLGSDSAADLDEDALLQRLEEDAVLENPDKASLGAVLKGRDVVRMGEREWEEATKGVKITSVTRDGPFASKDIQKQQRTNSEVATWFASMLALPQRGE